MQYMATAVNNLPRRTEVPCLFIPNNKKTNPPPIARRAMPSLKFRQAGFSPTRPACRHLSLIDNESVFLQIASFNNKPAGSDPLPATDLRFYLPIRNYPLL